MTTETRFPGTLTCCLIDPAGNHLDPGIVAPATDVTLLIEIATERRCRAIELTIEIWRGNCLRQRQELTVILAPEPPWRRAFAVRRGAGTAFSNRLTCRVLVNGAEAARLGFLEANVHVDPQGRFDTASERPVSEATMMVLRAEFGRLLGPNSSDGSRHPLL